MHSTKYIKTTDDLERLCDQLTPASRIALDTEFVGEESFIPRLELIQVATEHHSAIIDFPAVQESKALASFWDIVRNPQVEKVVHAGRQDLDLFATHAGAIPKPFFDTQIAAAMVGYGAQVAYANLVLRVHGKKLAKAHTFTNWSARPLTADQLAYALEDVEFLLAIHDHLRSRLHKLGRLEWADEEFSRLETVVGDTRREPQERYQRIRGWDSLKPKSAAVLRELAAWRESEARRRNVPRGRVMRDEVLLQLARHPPCSIDELRAVRGLHGSEVERQGETLLSTMQAAMALPASAWPDVPKERKVEPESTGMVELLQAVMKAQAANHEIAPALLATTSDLQALVDGRAQGTVPDLSVLRGWRRLLLGELLLQVLNGEVAVKIDPASGKLAWS